MKTNEAEEARIIAQRAERVRKAARERVVRRDQEAKGAASRPAPSADPKDIQPPRFMRTSQPRPELGADKGASAAKAAVQVSSETKSPAEQFLEAAPKPPSSRRSKRDDAALSLWKKLRSDRFFQGIVIVPMAIVAFYLLAIATPLYETQAVIAITRSSDSGESTSVGLLGNTEDSSTLQDAFRASAFINSQALMDALEEETGLITELSGSAMDPVRRLRSIPLLSIDHQDQFDRFIESSIDVQSGLITLYVRSPDPTQAIEVSDTVLRLTEDQVARLAQSLFDTRQSFAAESRRVAEAQMQDAQTRLVALQLEHQEVDPKNRVESIYARIQELESESQRLRSEIQKMEIEGFGDSPQIQKLRALDTATQAEIQSERSLLVSTDGQSLTPLNNLLMEYEMALLDVDLARQSVQSAIKAEAEAGREAALHRSHLQVVVPPGVPTAPIFPKIPGILAFWLIVLLAIYAAVRSVFRPQI